MNDNKGTSVALLNTTPGSMLFESIADKVLNLDFSLPVSLAPLWPSHPADLAEFAFVAPWAFPFGDPNLVTVLCKLSVKTLEPNVALAKLA